MDLGYGPRINKLFRKARKAAQEKRERDWEREDKIREDTQAHELALGAQREKGAMYRTMLGGTSDITRQRLADEASIDRTRMMYGPESVMSRELAFEKEKYPWQRQKEASELGLERRRLEQAGYLAGELPAYYMEKEGITVPPQPYMIEAPGRPGGTAREVPISMVGQGSYGTVNGREIPIDQTEMQKAELKKRLQGLSKEEALAYYKALNPEEKNLVKSLLGQ